MDFHISLDSKELLDRAVAYRDMPFTAQLKELWFAKGKDRIKTIGCCTMMGAMGKMGKSAEVGAAKVTNKQRQSDAQRRTWMASE